MLTQTTPVFCEPHLMNTFARIPVKLVRGDGIKLYDEHGKVYLDFLSGVGTVSLGHAHPAVTEAICGQVGRLTHVSNFFYVEHRDQLAARLVALFGDEGKVFFANSGAEAVEGALKLARKWGHTHKPEATTIVTALGSFHGRTYGAMTATGQPERALDFAPGLPGFQYVPFNDIEALDATLGGDTVALMLEVVQGESGVWPATQEYLDAASRWCKERNILLIIDEIQTGIYRTGAPFAFQHYGLSPDIITSAKALGNGYPMGAIIARSQVADTFKPGDHGTTYGGGPVACAAALATLTALEELTVDGLSICEHVEAVGEYARKRLTQIPHLTEVRGRGLMIGATLTDDAPLNAIQVRDALCEGGFIINAPSNTYIRLLPPLICKNMHIDAIIEALYAIMDTPGKETS